MSCVMTVSRSIVLFIKSMPVPGGAGDPAVPSPNISSGGNDDCPLMELVVIVRHNTGVLSRFVSLIDAEVAFNADLRARCKPWSGTSKLMTLSASD